MIDHGLNAQTTKSHGHIALLVLTELSLTLFHVNIVLYKGIHVRAVSVIIEVDRHKLISD